MTLASPLPTTPADTGPETSDKPTSHLLSAGGVLTDEWQTFVPVTDGAPGNDDSADAAKAASSDATQSPALPPDSPHWIVPLSVWVKHEATLRSRANPVGIQIDPADDPRALLHTGDAQINPAGIALIAVGFPSFNDGRGYSHAYALREHLGWTGELRAVGDVLIDTMFYLSRCGFDSYTVKAGHDPVEALKALNTFSQRYQKGYREIRQGQGQ